MRPKTSISCTATSIGCTFHCSIVLGPISPRSTTASILPTFRRSCGGGGARHIDNESGLHLVDEAKASHRMAVRPAPRQVDIAIKCVIDRAREVVVFGKKLLDGCTILGNEGFKATPCDGEWACVMASLPGLVVRRRAQLGNSGAAPP